MRLAPFLLDRAVVLVSELQDAHDVLDEFSLHVDGRAGHFDGLDERELPIPKQ